MTTTIPEFTLEGRPGDRLSTRIVCPCGETGAWMSRNWNYDDRSNVWEPQLRHLPKCSHFDKLRKTYDKSGVQTPAGDGSEAAKAAEGTGSEDSGG